MLCDLSHGVGSREQGEYPNLTTREFLFTHNVLHLNGNLCSFWAPGKEQIAHLELHFSHINDWSRRFFFILRAKPFIKSSPFVLFEGLRCVYDTFDAKVSV